MSKSLGIALEIVVSEHSGALALAKRAMDRLHDSNLMSWFDRSRIEPKRDGPYLVFMPRRSLDKFSVQHWDKIDGWSNDFGITHWAYLPDLPLSR